MTKPNALTLGLFTYTVLLALSVVFYKERIVMFDTAFQLFQIIRHHSFAIQQYRFGAVVTQVFPLVTSRLGGSLHAVTLSYSLSFTVFYFAGFLVTLLGLKNTRMAIANLLFVVLMTAHTFYWVQCELVQGVVFTLIYLAWIENQIQRPTLSRAFMIASPFLLITTVFFHPLLPFVFLFGMAFFYLHYQQKGKLLLVLSIAYIVTYILKAWLFRNDYDASLMLEMRNFLHLFPNYFSIQANKNFIHYCINDYYLLPLLWLGINAFYILRKERLKLMLFNAFFIGFLMIVNITHKGGGFQFYMESQYLPLVVFLAIPLCYDVLPAIHSRWIPAVLLLIMISLGLVRIWNTKKGYIERLDWYRHTLLTTDKLPNKKLILREAELPMKKIIYSWGSAYEFWLLSTLEQGQSRSLVIASQETEFDYELKNQKSFITLWENIPYQEMPDKRYFNFTDSTRYLKL